MEPHEVTWALVALAAVQAIHSFFTAWFAYAESKCRRQLRGVKDEVAHLRRRIAAEGDANRHAIADIATRVDTGGRPNNPPAV